MSYLFSSGVHHHSPISPMNHKTPMPCAYEHGMGASSALSSQSAPSSSTLSPSSDAPYMLHYYDRDDCEQHIACETIYDALVWARDEAQEHASKIHVYKLYHVELAP